MLSPFLNGGMFFNFFAKPCTFTSGETRYRSPFTVMVLSTLFTAVIRQTKPL